MSIIDGIGGRLRMMASRASSARRQRQTDRALAALPRHLLRDIGFERGLDGAVARTIGD